MLSPRFFCQFLSMAPSGCLFLIGFTRCICWQWTCSNRSSSKSFSSASVPHCLYSHISPRRSFSASKKEASTRLRSSRRWKRTSGGKTQTRELRDHLDIPNAAPRQKVSVSHGEFKKLKNGDTMAICQHPQEPKKFYVKFKSADPMWACIIGMGIFLVGLILMLRLRLRTFAWINCWQKTLHLKIA